MGRGWKSWLGHRLFLDSPGPKGANTDKMCLCYVEEPLKCASSMHDQTDAGQAGRSRQTERKPRISEDWLSLWTGLAVFVLSLGVFFGTDLLGFGAKVSLHHREQTRPP